MSVPRAALATAGLFLLLQGCVFLPQASRSPEYADCDLVTRELDLAYVEGGSLFSDVFRQHHGCVNEACLAVLVALAAIPAGSFVISGSIVIVGNTVHWFEAQGRCEDGAVQYFSDLVAGE